jgi:hypothetical protein
MTHALTVVLKPGYAPIEQYGDVASMTQGAWTDIYALACVVYYAITGKTPMSSVERLMDDRLAPIAEEAKGRYGDGFLRAIDAALAVKPQDRPQNAAQFRALLDIDLPAPPPAPPLSGYGALSHEPFPRTEEGGYSTVPGTLTPELATQLQARSAEPGAAVPATPVVLPVEARTAPPATATPPVAAPVPPAARRQPPAALPTPQRSGVGQRAMLLGAAALLVASGLAFAVYLALQPGQDDALKPSAPAASSAVAPASAATTPPVVPPASTAAQAVTAPASASAAAVVAPASAATASVAAPAASAAMPPPVAPAPRVETPRATPIEPAPPATTTRREPAAAASAPPRPRREPVRSEPPAEVRPSPGYAPGYTPGYAPTSPPTSPSARGARCSDILQKASLEPLTAEEAAYLKRECR